MSKEQCKKRRHSAKETYNFEEPTNPIAPLYRHFEAIHMSYIYVYTFMYIHLCIYIYVYTFMYVHLCMYIYVYTFMDIHLWMYIYVYTFMYIHLCIYIYVYTFMYIHLCTYIYVHTFMYIHLCTYIYVHTFMYDIASLCRHASAIFLYYLSVYTSYPLNTSAPPQTLQRVTNRLQHCTALDRTLLQNIVSFIGLFCKRDILF